MDSKVYLEGAEFAGDCAKVAVIREVALKLRALKAKTKVQYSKRWHEADEMSLKFEINTNNGE